MPDFEDIEIKCTSRFSRYPMYLFTIAFDSGENEILRLANNYGYYDKDFPDKKVIFRKVAQNISKENKYNFLFEVDKETKRIYLCVYDSSGSLIEKKSYINFDSLKNHLYTKLKKLAYIKASMKKFDDEIHYRYYSMFLYKLKSFDVFLNLIENGFINIEIIARIGKSGTSLGKYCNKNLVFSIKKEFIPRLFDCYYQYDYDRKY